MTKAEIIASLLDQARDKDALANGEGDSIFADDAQALREAAELLKSVPEWVSVEDRLPNDDATRLVWIGGLRLTARITTNYRQLKTIYQQRKNHRLPEWRAFCAWIETLPRAEFITGKRVDANG